MTRPGHATIHPRGATRRPRSLARGGGAGLSFGAFIPLPSPVLRMAFRVRHPSFWAGFAGFWLLAGLANSVTIGLYFAPEASWASVVLTCLYDSAGWALMSATGWFMAWRTPLERPSLGQRMLRLAGVALLLVAARAAVVDGLSRATPLPGLPARHLMAGMLPGHLLMAFTSLGVGYAFAHYLRYREQAAAVSRAQAQLARAELAALQAQLHPHFLFNALNSVAALMHADAPAAGRVLARLGQLLRLALERSGQAMVSLGQELDFVAAYLEIEQARMGGRLAVAMVVDPAAHAVPVPHLLLQPLVENAVRHGLAPRRGPGRLSVRAALRDGRLRLEVRDDGVGLPHGWSADRVGVGIGNTRARLAQLYGAAHRFHLAPGPEGGVCARIELPAGTAGRAGATAGVAAGDADGAPAADSAAAPRREAGRIAGIPYRRLLPWAAGLWSAYLLVSVLGLHASRRLSGRPTTLEDVLRTPVLATASWAVASLVLLRVAGRFPVTRGRRTAHLAANVAAALGLTLAYACLRTAAAGVPFPRAFHFAFPSFTIVAAHILGIGHALHYHAESRAQQAAAGELEARRTRAELAALQARLHPRFLFGALGSVAALMRTDVPAAERVLARLGDLLRLSLGRPRAGRPPLGEELDFAAAYLEVEAARRGGGLAVRVDAEPAARSVPIPRLLLQPLVEAALAGRAGRITLGASVDGDALRIEVREEGGARTAPADEGAAMDAVRARLAEAYGAGARADPAEWADGARTVTVRIPLAAEHTPAAVGAGRDG